MGIHKTLQADISYDIIEEFIGSYATMCDDMEALILGLEKPELYRENITRLFRIFHNIKSASGYMGLDRMHKASEVVESVLEEARALDGRGTHELVNWMLIANDIFGQWRRELETNAIELSAIPPSILKLPSKITI